MSDSISQKEKAPIPKVQEEVVDSMLKKLIKKKGEKNDTIVLLAFPELNKILNKDEADFVKELLNMDPSLYGFKEPFYGILPVPEDLVPIKGQIYTWEGEEKAISTQYLPKLVFNNLAKLNNSLKKELGRKLLVKSGYRSPAYQVFVLIYNLTKKEYNLEEVLKWVALPGYSEHGYPKKQAIDFITENGIINGEKATFSDTEEYTWLLKNGENFGFQLSYPEGNKEGVAFEPWHWHFSAERKNAGNPKP